MPLQESESSLHITEELWQMLGHKTYILMSTCIVDPSLMHKKTLFQSWCRSTEGLVNAGFVQIGPIDSAFLVMAFHPARCTFSGHGKKTCAPLVCDF
jgi:hypothetical protein